MALRTTVVKLPPASYQPPPVPAPRVKVSSLVGMPLSQTRSAAV